MEGTGLISQAIAQMLGDAAQLMKNSAQPIAQASPNGLS